jgi:ABC-type transport system involved in multi-copper enzyme maturation permease subunit
MINIPSSIDAVGALIKGYLPRVIQARGWALAGLIMAPVVVALIAQFARSQPFVTADNPTPAMAAAMVALLLYHQAYAAVILPVIALMAAPAGIREDMEQRTLPLMLVRPAPTWALPFGKGLLWFAWCSLWLIIAVALMPLVGLDTLTLPRKILALILTFWAQLGVASLFLLFFKRGTLWAAVFFFVWDPLVRVLPSALQRATFVHYVESLAGSRSHSNNAIDLLAQAQITAPRWLGVIILLAVGALAWGMCGLKLTRTPIGLAGGESEG